MNVIELAVQYFRAFASKDLAQLKELLHQDVKLTDWEVDLNGRDAVLAQMSQIFNACRSIEVVPVNIYNDKNTVIGELLIQLGSEKIIVVDILKFAEDKKINSVQAFKG